MVSFNAITILALSLLASLTAATPVNVAREPQPPPPGSVTATLIGAAGAQYTMEIPLNSEFTCTDNSLSISHIQTDCGPCAFYGVDGVKVVLPAYGGYTDVGPPQTIVGAVCGSIAW